VIPGRPAVFGEILYDHFADGSRVLGGAPLNVAAHLARLGAQPLLIGRIGIDDDGDAALARLTALGVPTDAVQRDPERPTGTVEVTIEGSEPRFRILPDQAWDRIDRAPASDAVTAADASLLYHGVLAARSARSRETLECLRIQSALPRFVDVNLRDPWTPLDRARSLAAGAEWLKVNQDELARLLGGEVAPDAEGLVAQAEALRSQLGCGRLVVSWGERGAWLFAPGRSPEHAAAEPRATREQNDSVGAGDALAATLLLGALAGWLDRTALERGVELAAAICGIRGAIPDDAAFYEPFRSAWGLAA